MPIPYVIPAEGTPDVAGIREFAAIRASFETWQEASKGEITFHYAGTTYARPASNDGLNTAGYWVKWGWTSLTGGASHDVVALTLLFWNSTTGEILEADILCNDEAYDWGVDGEPGKMDVQAVMTHEVGHFLGLGEEQSHLSSTMYPRITLGETHKRSLSEDDVIGVRTIYADLVATLATRLYQVVLGREPDQPGITFWTKFLHTTGDFQGAARGFLLSAEFLSWTDNANFVTTLYRTLLYREPDAEGFAHHLRLLDSGAISNEGLVDAFINSIEFRTLQIFP